jgi:filamentous hemagglutinin family protein
MLLAGLAATLLMGQPARALPQGGNVVHGTATVNVNGQNMTIQQASQQVIINWNGFSISAGELVNFIQPSQLASVLNRVTGVDPSVINGILQGNGNVFLINPNGVLIGPGGMVNTGGFLASTLELSNADFLSGNLRFKQGAGHDLSAVVNQGQIKVTDGGFVMLLAPSVANEGLIIAKSGEVALGAGTEATVNFDGRNLINFALAEAPVGTGTMVMSQASANNVLAQVVNSLGIEEAGSLAADGLIQAGDVLMQATGDVNVASQTLRGENITASTTNGNIELNSQFALDGGNITATTDNGNITFETLVAESLNGEGGVVSLSAGGAPVSSTGGQTTFQTSGSGNITSRGDGIAADTVLLDAGGSISTAVAANTLQANAGGNVNISLRPGVIDGSVSSTGGGSTTVGSTGTGTSPGGVGTGTSGGSANGGESTGTSSTGGQSSTSGGLSNSGPSQVFGIPSGGSGSSGSSSGSDGVFGTSPSHSSSSSSSSSSTTGTSGGGVSPGLQQSFPGGTLQQVADGGQGTVVGANGTLVTISAGGDINLDSVNTVIVDRISGRNVSVRSQTGSVVDNGDSVGADNRDIIASQSASLSAADFLGTIDDPLEVDIAGNLDVFAGNEVDGISGVLVGLVFGEYRQNSETAGVVLLNPGSSLSDGIAQAQRGVMDNMLPGDDSLGGSSVANLFLLRLINSIDEEDWLELLRGTVVWEDSADEATEADL